MFLHREMDTYAGTETETDRLSVMAVGNACNLAILALGIERATC